MPNYPGSESVLLGVVIAVGRSWDESSWVFLGCGGVLRELCKRWGENSGGGRTGMEGEG